MDHHAVSRRFLIAVVIVALCVPGVLLAVPGALAASLTEYPIPTPGSSAFGVTPGPDGNIWMTEVVSNKVARVSPDGSMVEFPVPAGSTPYGITAGPDGNLWIACMSGNDILRMSPAGDVLNQYPLPVAGSNPFDIVVGSDGALWFTESNAQKVGRITTSGVITEMGTPAGNQPYGLTVGPDGYLWVACYPGRVVRIDMGTLAIVNDFPVPGSVFDITSGPDGALWFTEYVGDKIGRITTAGAVTDYAVPTAACHPYMITGGPDGALWFTEVTAGKVGRINTSGVVTELSTSNPASQPHGIALGADSGVWFPAPGIDKICRVETERPVWYLAEGSTAHGFETAIWIENPNGAAVNAQVTYMVSGVGPVAGPIVPMPAESQAYVNPRGTLGEADFSTKVVCLEEQTIAVDRTMSWQGTGAVCGEGHGSIGVNSPSTEWYLPEGSSQWGFECWLLIQNPNQAAADCTLTYMIEGAPPVTVLKSVPAGSRATFNMADDIGAADASVKVSCAMPVIPERAMYRNDRREGHDSIGTVSPSYDFYLAEGTSAWGFTTYVLVQNPNPDPVDVTVTYMTGAGPVVEPAFNMPARSRRTINVNNDLPNRDFSTHVHGTRPIIAERAMYWDNGTGEACHDSIGMAQPHRSFYIPNGMQGIVGYISMPLTVASAYETFTLVQNPNTVPVDVRISYYPVDGVGGTVTFTTTIPASSRQTFDLSDRFSGESCSTKVECLTPDRKIMVEGATYWSPVGLTRLCAGTDTIGGFTD